MMLYKQCGKRVFDILGAAVCLLLLSPILLAIALLILLVDRQLPLLGQYRVGAGGASFRMLKFRTMHSSVRVLDRKASELALRGVLLKLDNDPRVTRLGATLRKYSLDELPQLWNVLRGQMSLVGPRPLLPFMVAPYPVENSLRGRVRPGLTGLWQIRAREQNRSLAEMIRYDLEYIDRMSVRTDFTIIMRTVPEILRAKGAN